MSKSTITYWNIERVNFEWRQIEEIGNSQALLPAILATEKKDLSRRLEQIARINIEYPDGFSFACNRSR